MLNGPVFACSCAACLVNRRSLRRIHEPLAVRRFDRAFNNLNVNAECDEARQPACAPRAQLRLQRA